MQLWRNVAKISLTQGKYTEVDDEDFELLSQYKWRLLKRHSSDKTGYAVTSHSPKLIRMHRFLLNAPKSMEVDHINGNSLDNHKQNLRLATRSQNASNRVAKGYYKYGNRYRAFCAGRAIGYFFTEEEAKNAYEKARKNKYGEFAWQKH